LPVARLLAITNSSCCGGRPTREWILHRWRLRLQLLPALLGPLLFLLESLLLLLLLLLLSVAAAPAAAAAAPLAPPLPAAPVPAPCFPTSAYLLLRLLLESSQLLLQDQEQLW
jgi:hypothetical protein